MMLTFEIDVLSGELVEAAQVLAVSEDEKWTVELRINDHTFCATGWDCLDAFNKIRFELETRYTFLCNGARPNFLLSPMASQAGGLKGYVVPPGRKARMSDLVSIFDAAPSEEVGTVMQQVAFRSMYMERVESGEMPE
jgi:hypothetical protein